MSETSRGAPRLLLVGGGHAHLEVLRRIAEEPTRLFDLTLVSATARHHYSGMVPGYLQGTYGEAAISFDLAALARAAGGRFVHGRATALDPSSRQIRLEDGTALGYDLASFNIGSIPNGSDRDDVARHALVVKPMSRAVALRDRLVSLAAERPTRVVETAVVGGGAAGVEVAIAIAAVLDTAAVPREVTIVEADETILGGYSRRFRRLAARALRHLRIAVRTGSPAHKVSADGVELGDGSRLPSRLTVWLTPATAPPIFRDAGLEVDHRGFLWLQDTLQSTRSPDVLAAGDCGTLASHPATAKAGVYAVRQGPMLFHNLRALAEGQSLVRFEPQGQFLSILNASRGRALLDYRGFASWSRWSWWLKDWIDRRFVERYQALVR